MINKHKHIIDINSTVLLYISLIRIAIPSKILNDERNQVT